MGRPPQGVIPGFRNNSPRSIHEGFWPPNNVYLLVMSFSLTGTCVGLEIKLACVPHAEMICSAKGLRVPDTVSNASKSLKLGTLAIAISTLNGLSPVVS